MSASIHRRPFGKLPTATFSELNLELMHCLLIIFINDLLLISE